jgi:hypothetical protein
MEKTLIYYHRAYRKITGAGWIPLLEFIAIAIPFSLAVLFFYPPVTQQMSKIAHSILSAYYLPGSVILLEKTFLIGNVLIVDLPDRYPTAMICLINFFVSLILILFLPRLRTAKNIAIYVVFLAIINIVSAIFFTTLPFDFPYSNQDFSELYIKSEVSMWLFIPFALGIAFLPLPASIFPKILLVILTLIYSVIFGTLRYIIFLFIISRFSVIYMALLFFAFGPLIDFIYIVGIYSFYTCRLAKKLKGSESVWKWSY